MHIWQDKTHNLDTDTEAVEPAQKATIKNTTATRVPAWATAGGETLPAGLQAKLTINQPGDVYEQEADRVAEQVMRMPAGGTPDTREDMPVMRKESSGGQASHDASPVVQQALSSGGQPLDTGVQTSMEARFGQDFNHVRVHTDEQAAESAQAINARAYTVRSDVVFGEGEYRPETGEGQRLLAHELTHVVQQDVISQRISQGGVLQRFEAPEHIDIGETGASLKVKLSNGLELTYGEISALVGDFFETPEMLDKADPEEVKHILKLVKEQHQAGGKLKQSDVEFQEATQVREKTVYDPATGAELGKQGQFRGGKKAGTAKELETESYFSLAKKNILHFTPENIRSGWSQGHAKALDYAQKSNEAVKQGKNDDAAELRRQALLTDAGSAHFLEDAFSSGHILNPVDVKDWMTKQWTTNPDFKERALKRLKEAAHKDVWYGPNSTIDKRIDALLRSISVDVVSSAGLKVLHDYLNQKGIDVINGRGDTWRAFGDFNLWKSPDTMKFAGEAVALSKQQVLDKLSGKSVNPADVLQLPPAKVVIAGYADLVSVGTEATKKLLSVLESLLLASDDLWKLLKVASDTQEKAITPFEISELEAATAAEKKQRGTMERDGKKYDDIANNIIKARTGFLGSLDEAKLATDLLSQPDELVETVLDRLVSHNRDDVSYEYMKQIPQEPRETQLRKRGVHLLLRLQAELLSGYVSAEERAQAYRIGTILKRVPEGAKATAPGEFTTRQMEVATVTAGSSAKKAAEEASTLRPEHILDATQVAAASLIEKHTSWGNLDEGKLAADLKGKPVNVIIEVIDQLQPSDDDDDVSLEYMKRIPVSSGEIDLRKEDHNVLRRLRRALRSGSVAKDEEAQAQRIDGVLGAL